MSLTAGRAVAYGYGGEKVGVSLQWRRSLTWGIVREETARYFEMMDTPPWFAKGKETPVKAEPLHKSEGAVSQSWPSQRSCAENLRRHLAETDGGVEVSTEGVPLAHTWVRRPEYSFS